MRSPSFASVLARSGTRGLLNQIGFEVGSTMQERAYYRGALTEIRDEFVDSGANSRRAQHEPRRWRKIRNACENAMSRHWDKTLGR